MEHSRTLEYRHMTSNGDENENISLQSLYDLINKDDAPAAALYYLQNKTNFLHSEHSRLEYLIFSAAKRYFDPHTDTCSYNIAVSMYNKIPRSFWLGKDISEIGYAIFIKFAIARNFIFSPGEIVAYFKDAPELMVAALANNNFNKSRYNISSRDKAYLIYTEYNLHGPSMHIARLNKNDFEDADTSLILPALFESYRRYDVLKLLNNIQLMNGLINQLPRADYGVIMDYLIQHHAFNVMRFLHLLNLNHSQIMSLAREIEKKTNNHDLPSTLNAQEFDDLLETNLVLLFTNRFKYNLSTEQHMALLTKICSSKSTVGLILETLEQKKHAIPRLNDYEMIIIESTLKSLPSDDLLRIACQYKHTLFGLYNSIITPFRNELTATIGIYKQDDYSNDELVNYMAQDNLGWSKNMTRVCALMESYRLVADTIKNDYIQKMYATHNKLPENVLKRIEEHIRKSGVNAFTIVVALKSNVSIEQAQYDIEHKMSQTIANADYFMSTRLDALKDILTSCRFVNIFDIDKDNLNNTSHRAMSEEEMFNYENERPVFYGYISDNVHGNLQHYGNIHLKFRHSVEQIATVTFNDSLDTHSLPTPAMLPHTISIVLRDKDNTDIFHASNPSDWGSNYLEVQYHGLSVNDIESVNVPINLFVQSEINEIKRTVNSFNEKNNSNVQLIAYS